MEQQTLSDLLLAVGEIRSDVKTLLKSDADKSDRLGKLEHRQWWVAGLASGIAFVATQLGLGHLIHFT